jgi:hypothetical protein
LTRATSRQMSAGVEASTGVATGAPLQAASATSAALARPIEPENRMVLPHGSERAALIARGRSLLSVSLS